MLIKKVCGCWRESKNLARSVGLVIRYLESVAFGTDDGRAEACFLPLGRDVNEEEEGGCGGGGVFDKESCITFTAAMCVVVVRVLFCVSSRAFQLPLLEVTESLW